MAPASPGIGQMPFQLPLLQRYLFGELLRVFLFVLGCITILLVFVGVFQQAMETGLGPMHVLKILPYIVPSMLPFTIPAALLLTVSVVYGRVAGDQEATAAKSAGVHPVTLMSPSFVLGAALSICSFFLTDQVIPWSVHQIEKQVLSLMEDILIDRLRTDLQFTDHRHGLHVTVARVEGRRLIQPIFRFVRGRRIVTLHAREALLHLDMTERQILVKLTDGYVDVDGQGRVIFSGDKIEAIRWDGPVREAKPRHMPITQITQTLDDVKRSDAAADEEATLRAAMSLMVGDFSGFVNDQAERWRALTSTRERQARLTTEVHSRLALACSCFFFTLIGAPFSLLFGRSQFLTSFLFCFTPIVAGYYPLMLGLMTQAKKGHLDPSWSMWIANAVLGLVAIIATRRVVRY